MVTEAVLRLPLGRSGLVVLVDELDYEAPHRVGFKNGRVWQGRICDRKWQPSRRRGGGVYAKCLWQQEGCLMELLLHRVILDAAHGQLVDHANGDRLDCRRANLRFATPLQNAMNRLGQGGSQSQFKGVTPHKATGKFESCIRVNRIKRHLGVFADEVDAALAYDAAARQHFGEFARLNFQ